VIPFPFDAFVAALAIGCVAVGLAVGSVFVLVLRAVSDARGRARV
jgi:hypothetical protein